MHTARSWDRRSGESPQAFEAFQRYRNEGARRSISRTALDLGKSRSVLEEWSSRHQWYRRCAEWDAHLDRVDQEEREQAVRDMHFRHAAVAQLAFARVAERLQSLDPGEIPIRSVATLFEAAVRVERAALASPPTTTSPPTAIDVDEWPISDEERMARVYKVMEDVGLLPPPPSGAPDTDES